MISDGLLDGFDELTPPQFASSVSNLRQARKFAVEIVRRFIEQTPQNAPIVIAGRESYFDNRQEAASALGYGENAQVFDLAGFTDKDIERFLKTKRDEVPSWLPTRPLLLGYLANAGMLEGQEQLLSLDPASGWDKMLRLVCEREVNQVWGVGFEASDLRLFIEGLATRARKSRDGRGLDDSALRSVFRAVFGRDTDEPASLLTMRLPGLGSSPVELARESSLMLTLPTLPQVVILGATSRGPLSTVHRWRTPLSSWGAWGGRWRSRGWPTRMPRYRSR